VKRRREFDNLDLVFHGYRNRAVFRYLSDEHLWAYIRGITRPKTDGRYELVYSPEWETHIYYTGIWRDADLWRDLKHLELPILIIRGAESDTFWESAARLVKRKQPKVRIEAVSQSTHLVPLERPKEVFEIMQSFLGETFKV
jgi:pimeloyl-ACP methyl ester carboxylesterase